MSVAALIGSSPYASGCPASRMRLWQCAYCARQLWEAPGVRMRTKDHILPSMPGVRRVPALASDA